MSARSIPPFWRLVLLALMAALAWSPSLLDAASPATGAQFSNGAMYYGAKPTSGQALGNSAGSLTGIDVVPDPGANGIVVRTGAGTSAARTLTAGNRIAITNGSGASGAPTIAVSEAAPVTVSSSTATLAATDTVVQVTTTATNITLAAASAAATGHQAAIHCARSSACLVTLTRAGSDTIDAATARAGLIPPGGMIHLFKVDASAWTSTLDIRFSNGMSYFEWRPDSSSGNLSNVASGWTTAGTTGATSRGGRLHAELSRAGSTAATGWTHGSKFYLSDGEPAWVVDLYNSATTSNQHRGMIGMVSALYSGARSAWSDKGMVLSYDASSDTNWYGLVRDSTTSAHDTGAALAAGYYRLFECRDGTTLRWVIYYSATDATFAGVTPTVGSATPSAWPSATTLQGQIYFAAGLSWTGTLGVAYAAYGELL